MERILKVYDKLEFQFVKQKFQDDDLEIISISKCLVAEKASEVSSLATVVDISSLASAFVEKATAQHIFEQLIDHFDDDQIFIIDASSLEVIDYYLRYCFENIEDLKFEEPTYVSKKHFSKIKKITDLDNEQLITFIESVKTNLYGHKLFKNKFGELLRVFRMFNLLGEQKILSLFIMGESGVGKTELARIISKNLDSDTKLAKINFGNYSSKDALNSLIGSPRGYIGSDGGELFNRVLDSDSGVILIDEFEKSDQAVFNYFLDVLESGKLVNSLGEEIDINGYIIVFTSNIDQEHFFRRISPELRSRFTYICKFDPLSKEEKEQFLETRLNKIFEKYAKVFKVQLVDNYKIEIQSKIDVNSYTNMRDLNNAIRLSFTEFITEIS